MESAAQLNRCEPASPKRVVGRPFAKGVSGNRKGRPRKAVTAAEIRRIARGSIHEMVRAAAFAPVQVEIDGELAEVTALEAGMRQVAMQAAAGDRLALLAMTRLLAAAERDAAMVAEQEAQEAEEAEEEQAEAVPDANLDRAGLLAAARERLERVETGHPQTAVADVPEPEPAPEPEAALEPDEPPLPADEEATACRDICTRALAAAGGACVWVKAPEPGQAATAEGLRSWLGALKDSWDRLEYAWGSSRLYDHRKELERQQNRVERARAVVAQGLAEWDARVAVRALADGRDAAVPDGMADPPGPDGTDAEEARAYVRICTEALELAKGAYLDVRAPKPSPHLVVVGADGRVEWHGDAGPDGGPTMANLRRWPARLEAVAAELETAMGRTGCAGELVRLRSGRRIVERMREIVEDGVTEWDAGDATLQGLRKLSP